MCGRFKLTVPFREIVRLYNLTNSVNLLARYNIAPTQESSPCLAALRGISVVVR